MYAFIAIFFMVFSVVMYAFERTWRLCCAHKSTVRTIVEWVDGNVYSLKTTHYVCNHCMKRWLAECETIREITNMEEEMDRLARELGY